MIWALYGIVLYHLRKALYWHAQARQWIKRPAPRPAARDQARGESETGNGPATDTAEGDVCLLLPDTREQDD